MNTKKKHKLKKEVEEKLLQYLKENENRESKDNESQTQS